VHANFDSVESLTKALQGQDAVVSTVGSAGLQNQALVIDAAIAAGVKRFIPSEFGSNTDNPKARQLPVFGYKVATQKYLEEKATTNPDFTYTLIRNSAFLDWGLQVGFLLSWQTGKYRIFNGGDQLFSATTLPSIGTAVVGVLTHYEETKNRGVEIEDIRISQNQLLAIAKRIAPEKKWEVIPTNLADLKKAADEELSKGNYSEKVMYDYLPLAIFGEGYGGVLTGADNELLGISAKKTEADIEAILKPLLK
jgi:hypothetical protein